jgi:hypothetical protein
MNRELARSLASTLVTLFALPISLGSGGCAEGPETLDIDDEVEDLEASEPLAVVGGLVLQGESCVQLATLSTPQIAAVNGAGSALDMTPRERSDAGVAMTTTLPSDVASALSAISAHPCAAAPEWRCLVSKPGQPPKAVCTNAFATCWFSAAGNYCRTPGGGV